MTTRRMVLEAVAAGCVAEAWLNGVAIVRAGPAPARVTVSVNEYVAANTNHLALHVQGPAPGKPVAADAVAQARLLLPGPGAVMDDAARALASCAWKATSGEPPQAVVVDLPLAFPRWRWLDAPRTDPAAAPAAAALAFVQHAAQSLSEGRVDEFCAALRVRTHEVALAYQGEPRAGQERLRQALLQGHAQGLAWHAPEAGDFRLRPLADGRMFECLDGAGAPALAAAAGESGPSWRLPLRLACHDGRLHVLR